MNKKHYYKMRKMKSVFMALTFLVFQIFSILPVMQVSAADVTNKLQFINEVNLTGDDGKLINESLNPISKNIEVKLTYKFTIPNKGEIKKGDNYTMQIPKEIQIISKLNFPITLDNGDTIANVTIDTDGKVNMIFTEFVEDNSNVSGFFYIHTQFNPDKIEGPDPVSLEFQLGGNSPPYIINLNFEQPEAPKASIEKEGSYDYLKNEITWKVTVNPENVKIKNPQIVDRILDGQEFIQGSVRINGIDAKTADYNYNSIDRKLIYNLPKEIDKEKVITFKTKVTDSKISQSEGATVYKYNKAIFNHDGTTVVSNEASVKIVTDFINKNGSYDPLTKRINWVINVNNNAQQIPDAIVTDNIPEGLKLTEDSVKLDGITSNSYKLEGQKFIFVFKNEINEPHKITFSTDVVDSDAYNSNVGKEYKNTVVLTGKGVPDNASDTKGVSVPTSIISKQGIGYNPATGEITWKITVNSNGISIKNAVVTDEIGIGQEYVEGSASINKGTSKGAFNYVKADLKDKGKTGTLKYEFNDTISEIHTITFKTKVTDPNVYAGNRNEDYYNTSKLEGDNIIPSTSQGEQNVQSQVINKDSENFDYVKKEFTWRIVINENNMILSNAYVTDVIGEKQEFVPDSIMLNGILAEKLNYTYDKHSKTLRYNFPIEIKDKQVITFKTKIIDDSIFNTNGEKKFNNTAKLITDLLPKGIESTGTAVVKSTLIDKNADYTRGNSYIDWNVNINSNKILIKDAALTDILQEGLELDTTSVKLYKRILNPNGTLSKGEEVALGKDNVKYNAVTRECTFTLPSSTKEAYILTFRTNVVDKKKSPFTNTISFKGTGITEESGSNKVDVIFQGAGGGGVGETGSIKVLKVDNSSENTKLEGAVFELLDKYQNVIKTSVPTGSNGEAIFNRLKFDIDYYVREKIAPKGYSLSSELYKFQLKNTKDEKNIVYSYKNKKIKGEIEFFKTENNNNPLKGAEFTLYNLSDKDYTKPLTIAISDENGKVQFNNVEYGEYAIKETKAPEGYIPSSEILKANITEDGKVVKANPYSISNTKIIGNIEFTKQGEDKKPLQGAEFKLYREADKNFENPISISISDENGHVEFKDIDYGKYNIRETKAPEGYSISSETLKASITENGKVVKANPYSISNKKIRGSIEVKKLDGNKKPLKGAEFTLCDTEGNPIKTSVSGENGIALFENLVYGKYTIKETKVPEGYLASEGDIKVFVDRDGELYKYEVINNKIKGNILITKTDMNGKLLQGAEFTLYDREGKKITTRISDNNGVAVFNDVDYGKYTIKETKAPKGYILSKKQLEVNISSPETQKFTIENEAEKIIDKIADVLPKTGGIFDFKVMITIGSLSILIGIVLLVKRNKVI